MKIILLAFLLVFGVFTQTNNQQKNQQKDVIILDDKNLMPMIYGSLDPWLIDLYAPWCGHCMKMTSDWSKLATNLKGLVKVAKIDASKYPQFNEMYGLKGYPHIVFIPGGQKNKQNFYVHQGPRTAEALQFWTFQKIAQHKRTIIQELTDRRKWNQVCIGPHSDFCVVFFLPRVTQSESEQERKSYMKIISEAIKKFNRQPVSFLWTQAGDHSTLQKQLKVSEQLPSVVLINPNNKKFSVMKKSFTEDDFQNWLKNILDIQFQEIQGDFIFGTQQNKQQTDEKNDSNSEL